jgi:WS/DGAT/MGAT family acyltransferase
MASTPVASSPMSSSEAVLWMIERDPVLRSTIVVLCMLSGPPDADRVQERLASAAIAFPRLRQRVGTSRTGTRRWVDGGSVDLDHHLRHVRLPAPGSMRQVLDLAGAIAGEAFDPARPLWQATLIDGVEDGRAALLIKVHHAVTDGLGGVALLPILMDATAEAEERTDGWAAAATASASSHHDGLLHLATRLGDMASHPGHVLASAPRVARSVGKLLAPATHALSPVTTDRGLDRYLTTFDVTKQELADAAHAVGGTLNDAFLAAVVGGLRRYHLGHGFAVDELRVTMPISTRRDDDAAGGNRFAPARFVVPTSISDPVERMRALGVIAREWRHEPAVALSSVLASGLARLPDAVTTSIFGSMLKGVDFVATNVPGAAGPIWMGGAEVERMYGFAPPAGAAMNIALVSHGATCCIGINMDRTAIPDPETLTQSLVEGFAEVVERGRQAGAAESPTVRVAPAEAGRPARLSALDTGFLALERPGLPMHVGALMVLDGAPLTDEGGHVRIDAIRGEIASRLHRCPRMAQRVTPVPFGVARPAWRDDPDFDVARHVHLLELPPPASREQLLELSDEVQSRPLPRTRPLWEMWFVGGMADGTVGLIYKVHHALVDGVSAAETFVRLLSPGPAGGEPVTAAPGRPIGSRRTPRRGRLLREALQDQTRSAWSGVTGAAGALLQPRTALVPIAGLGRLLTHRPVAPASPLNTAVGGSRRLSSLAFDVAELKSVGHRHRATLNDVVLALVTSGLQAMLVDDPAGNGRPPRAAPRAAGEGVNGRVPPRLNVLVPVSLRPPGEEGSPGNRVTGLVVALPVELHDPRDQLAAIAEQTARLKAGPEGAGLELILRSAELWPPVAVSLVGRLIDHQPFVNLVVTNVRGPDTPLFLLGAQVREIIPVIPLGGNLALGVAVFSYDGQLVLGIQRDADTDLDVHAFADGARRALTALGRTRPRRRG